MITDEGKRICDKEIWSYRKNMWCGCRKPAKFNVISKHITAGLDYCTAHSGKVIHQLCQCPSCKGKGYTNPAFNCRWCEGTGVVLEEDAVAFGSGD